MNEREAELSQLRARLEADANAAGDTMEAMKSSVEEVRCVAMAADAVPLSAYCPRSSPRDPALAAK